MVRANVLASCLALFAVSGCASGPELEVRAAGASRAPVFTSSNLQIADAQGHFRLGNVALAAEGFRKALREQPQSIDALNGLAACYDRLGRYDLSRSYYERALALAPGDQRLYANLATSLMLQGRMSEAQAVQEEYAARIAPRSAPKEKLGATAEALAARGAHLPVDPPLVRSLGAQTSSRLVKSEGAGPRLQRMSLGEVALVTRPINSSTTLRSAFASIRPTPALRQSSVVQTSKASTTAKPASSPLRVTVLNAARVPRAASNTRQRLNRLGWNSVAIGDGERSLDRSLVAYAPPQRVEAERLARTLGMTARPSRTVPAGLLLVLVGRDAARPGSNT